MAFVLQAPYRDGKVSVAPERKGGTGAYAATVPLAHGRTFRRAEKTHFTVKTRALLKPVFTGTLTVEKRLKNLQKSLENADFSQCH